MRNLTVIFLSMTLSALPALSRWDARAENYFLGKYVDVQTSTLDPQNQIFNRPSVIGAADLRFEVRYSYKNIHKLVLRPRWVYTQDIVEYKDGSDARNVGQGRGNITDAYWEHVWNEYIRTTVGLQVYQWGSAEFLNASNPFYHLNTQQRSILYKEKGKVLARVNVDYNRNWNQVFIYEPISNAETQWIEGQEFVPKGLIKTEWVSNSGVNSVGFVFGSEERQMGFFGEYFNYSPLEGLTVYLDSKHVENSVAYYPDSNRYGTESLIYDPITRGGWVSFGVAGIRKEWTYLDLRFEYVYNTAGWTKTQLNESIQTLKNINPDQPLNYSRFVRPGLELLGRGYGYLSFRFFNLGPKNNHSFAIRGLISETDASSTVFANYDWEASDSLNLLAEVSGSFGTSESELNLLPQQSGMLGFRWSF